MEMVACGHSPRRDQPDALDAAIERFLRDATAGPGQGRIAVASPLPPVVGDALDARVSGPSMRFMGHPTEGA